MSEDKKPIIIHFRLHAEYDARGHDAYFQAPDDFADMTPEERQSFLDEELKTWHQEVVEPAWSVYEGHAEAHQETKDQWSGQYSPDQLEERW